METLNTSNPNNYEYTTKHLEIHILGGIKTNKLESLRITLSILSGLVTQEDMIETLLGLEIMDESDTIEDMQLLARKSWERRAKRLGIIEDQTTDD